ncbi:hypothetical protein [Flavobacterium caeni]|uniref:Uncharacterized protein n=1 Tax=Flavobacterium caeni TaxID=490189 RepID=A0A1G5JVS5_9FLAO|nr:hypothetical protein [Flavobacterium caeni]SCY92436.1 hypothetical protein SAMN02927903_02927 [Flavobacterium caeni]
MKTLITLSLALSFFGQANAETNLVKGIVSTELEVAAHRAQQFENALIAVAVNEPGKLAPIADTAVAMPESLVALYNKTVEEVIAEDKRITESEIKDEGYLFFQEITPEETIVKDNQIIESNLSEEIRPLYLERTVEDMIQEDNAVIEAVMPDVWNCPQVKF